MEAVGGRRSAPEVGARAALTALVIAAAFCIVAGTARAALYKWVDEKGVVHYTDTLPPEAVDKARTELNNQGVPLKKMDKALSPSNAVRSNRTRKGRNRRLGNRKKRPGAIEPCSRRIRAS
jgi:hypothetical protein